MHDANVNVQNTCHASLVMAFKKRNELCVSNRCGGVHFNEGKGNAMKHSKVQIRRSQVLATSIPTLRPLCYIQLVMLLGYNRHSQPAQSAVY